MYSTHKERENYVYFEKLNQKVQKQKWKTDNVHAHTNKPNKHTSKHTNNQREGRQGGYSVSYLADHLHIALILLKVHVSLIKQREALDRPRLANTHAKTGKLDIKHCK